MTGLKTDSSPSADDNSTARTAASTPEDAAKASSASSANNAFNNGGPQQQQQQPQQSQQSQATQVTQTQPPQQPTVQPPQQIVVKGAGAREVNGIYHFDGYFQNACKYSKEGKWSNNGSKNNKKNARKRRNVTFCIFQCLVGDDTKHWYISIVPSEVDKDSGEPQEPGTTLDIDFYSAPVLPDCQVLPPTQGWITSDTTRKGQWPPPILSCHVVNDENTENGRQPAAAAAAAAAQSSSSASLLETRKTQTPAVERPSSESTSTMMIAPDQPQQLQLQLQPQQITPQQIVPQQLQPQQQQQQQPSSSTTITTPPPTMNQQQADALLVAECTSMRTKLEELEKDKENLIQLNQMLMTKNKQQQADMEALVQKQHVVQVNSKAHIATLCATIANLERQEKKDSKNIHRLSKDLLKSQQETESLRQKLNTQSDFMNRLRQAAECHVQLQQHPPTAAANDSSNHVDEEDDDNILENDDARFSDAKPTDTGTSTNPKHASRSRVLRCQDKACNQANNPNSPTTTTTSPLVHAIQKARARITDMDSSSNNNSRNNSKAINNNNNNHTLHQAINNKAKTTTSSKTTKKTSYDDNDNDDKKDDMGDNAKDVS